MFIRYINILTKDFRRLYLFKNFSENKCLKLIA